VKSRVGWCVCASAELAPGHPEKVLVVRRDFAEHFAGEHEALIAALLDAAEFCDAPENREAVISVLSRPEYLGRAAGAALLPGLSGEFDFGRGVVRRVEDFVVFHRQAANEPSADKAGWILQEMRAANLAANNSELTPAFARAIFRCDIYDRACALRAKTPTQYENKNHDNHPVLA
jgi:ABC-type nitrate/sulfonate/bicarbonate transport system substrate-binding protein